MVIASAAITISIILQPMAAKAMEIIKDKGLEIGRYIVGMAVDKVTGKAIDNTIEKVVGKLDGIVNIERDISRLQNTLSIIEGIRQVSEKKQIDNDFIQNWLRDLVDIAYEARDVLDDFITFSNCVITAEEASKPVNFISSLIMKYFGGSSTGTSYIPLALLNQLAKDIRSVREKFDEKKKDGKTFVTLKSVLGGGGSESVLLDRRPEVGPFINKQRDALFSGRGEEKEGIMEKILPRSDDDNDVHVVAIWGMGGIGKTTLAQSIYNDVQNVVAQNVRRSWLFVGENKFSAEKVIREMVNDQNTTGIANLQTKLVNQLRGDRFLIVLDDVWDVDGSEWDLLLNPLTHVGKGGLIIITTMKREVCTATNTQTKYDLKPLSEEDSWLIFENYAYVNGKSDSTQDTRDLKGIGKDIVKKLNGLPLALKVVGRSLLNKDSSTWTNFLESKLTNDNKVMSALTWSYNNLPRHLKTCFTYCALFPKGHEFDKRVLVEMWMAHDLIQKEDVGAQYFEELVNASLLQCVDGKHVMHDLIHDLALLASNGEFASANSSLTNDQMEKVRHITITRGEYSKIPRLCKIEKLLTLYTISSGEEDTNRHDNLVLDDVFKKLKSIRVLVLSGEWINEIPDCISELSHLRYLDVSETGVGSFPNSLCHLYNLQMIAAPPDVVLPRDIVTIVNLRYIRAILSTCKGVEKLTSLQELSSIRASDCPKLEFLPSLERFDKLQTLELSNCPKLNSLPPLGELTSLKHLSLVNVGVKSLGAEFYGEFTKNKVFFQSLESLSFGNMQELKEWTDIILENSSVSFFPILTSLELSNCPMLESLLPLGELTSLKHLSLVNVGVKSLGAEFYGEFTENKVFFKSLESLSFGNMQELKEWAHIIVENYSMPFFPLLTSLELSNCPKLESLPPLGELKSLEHIRLWKVGVKRLGREFYGKFADGKVFFESLESLRVFAMNRWEEWDDIIIRNSNVSFFPSLTTLEIHRCPKLLKVLPIVKEREDDEHPIMNPTIFMKSLSSLKIWNCDGLKQLQLRALVSLKELDISHCNSLVNNHSVKSNHQPLHHWHDEIKHIRNRSLSFGKYKYNLVDGTVEELKILRDPESQLFTTKISTILQPMAAKARGIIKDKGKAIVRSTAKRAIVDNIERDISKLQTTLCMIEGIVQVAEEKQIDDDLIRNWLRDLVDIGYEARDVLDNFITFFSCDIRAEEASNLVNFISSFMNSPVDRLSIDKSKLNPLAKDIRNVRERFDEMKEEGETFTKLKSAVGGEGSESVRVEGRTKVEPFINKQRDALFLGRGEEKEGIMEKILPRSDDDNDVHVVAIWGMGGIGKTTLAQSIYNDVQNVVVQNVRRSWLFVGENKFSAEKVIRDMVNDQNTTGIANLQTKLVNQLRGDRFLIVLDDVWDVDGSEWDLLLNPLTRVGKGGLIIITTMKREVCTATNTQTKYDLKPLSEEDSWSIFESYAYDNGKSDNTSELKPIGEEIVKKLNGLPLALKVVGRSLLNKDYSNWTNFLESKFTKDDEVMSALRRSYNHLPRHLKTCFIYCSLFPKDHVLDKKALVEMWMAHDLIQKEDVGAQYFTELVNASLLQYVDGTYVMHYLIHDLALFVSNEEFETISNSSFTNDQMETVRHITITPDDYSKIPHLCKNEKLLTLYTISSGEEDTNRHDNLVLDDIFKQLKSLRVLVLYGKGIKEIPDCISKLKHLRYLDVSQTSVKSLPDSLCDLYNLQTIAAPSCAVLPIDIVNLVNLRYIRAILSTCKGIKKLTSLQELSSIRVCKDDNIGELADMQLLRGKLTIRGLENVEKLEDDVGALMEKQSLVDELVLEFDKQLEKSTISEKVLDALGCPPKLIYLEISGYTVLKSPSWMVDKKHKFDQLKTLKLYACWMDSLPPLGELTSLKHLSLTSIIGIKRLRKEFYGELFTEHKIFFPSLESLSFDNMPEWEEWDDIIIRNSNVSFFPSLTTLEIHRCPKLLKVLPVVEEREDDEHPIVNPAIFMKSLSSLKIWNCDGLKQLQLDALVSLKELMISHWSSLQSLPAHFNRLSFLISLRIKSCQQLQFLPPNFHELSSLEDLSIDDCPQLQSLPAHGLPPSMKSLELLNCPFLYERCKDECGSDWHKIKRIPKLTIFGDHKVHRYGGDR